MYLLLPVMRMLKVTVTVKMVMMMMRRRRRRREMRAAQIVTERTLNQTN